jgi:hypothetical protein
MRSSTEGTEVSNEIDNLITMVAKESAEEVQRLYALEQTIAEQNGVWTEEVGHEMLTVTRDMAETMQVLTLALATMRSEMTTPTPPVTHL